MEKLKLNSTGEEVRRLDLTRKTINLHLAKYGRKGDKLINSVFDGLRIPRGKVMLPEYGHYMLTNNSVQLIHRSKIKVV